MKLQSLSPRTPTSLDYSIRKSRFGSDIELVKRREGIKLYWYRDSLGYLTGGYGHLKRKGDPEVFVQADADKWLETDIGGARKAATKQFARLPYQTQSLYDVLVSCNYQFGNDFDTDFPNSFQLIVDGKYDEAVVAFQRTLWYRQTPTRVKDLQEALKDAIQLARQYHSLGLN